MGGENWNSCINPSGLGRVPRAEMDRTYSFILKEE